MRNWVVHLLESYRDRAKQIDLLHYELEHAPNVSAEEVISAMSFGHSNGTGRSKGHIQEKATTISSDLKTKAGKRDIPLSEELEKWLRARQQSAHAKYVFAMKNRKPMTLSSYKSMWRHIERELPEVHISAHILRHTYITRMFEAGLDIKEVQYLAGHSTVDMTLRVYTHYDQRSRREKTAEKVREALQPRLSA